MFILLAIFSFFFLIFLHEAGHFLAAKVLGKPAPVFSIGMGTRLLEKRIGDTIYAFSFLPIGGYVRFLTDTNQRSVIQPERSQVSKILFPRSRRELDLEEELYHKGKLNGISSLQQIIILLAGPLANLAAAIVFSQAGFFLSDNEYLVDRVHFEVIQDLPADLAGLTIDHTIVGFNGTKIYSWNDLKYPLNQALDNKESLSFEVDKDSELNTITLAHQEGSLIDYGLKAVREYRRPTLNESVQFLYLGATALFGSVLRIPSAVWQKVSSSETEIPPEPHYKYYEDGSPGLVQTVNHISDSARDSTSSLFYTLGVLSFFLFFVNMLPFPALDGGQVLVIILHALFPSTVTYSRARAISVVGLFCILCFSVYLIIAELMFFSTHLF